MNHELFANRVALVVGGGRGIGAACAKALAGAGAQICVVSRTMDDLTGVCGSIENSGGEAIAIQADLVVETEVAQAVERALERFGRIDFVINFAASVDPLRKPLWQVSSSDWQKTLAVNLTGPLNLARTIVPLMLKQREGMLIFVSSPLGDQVFPGTGAYGCSRAGANRFVLQLAAELDGSGVTASLVYPGVTDTPGLKDFQQAMGRTAGPPLRRMGWSRAEDPATMADLFVWLCTLRRSEVNGFVFAWDDPNVRRAVNAFCGQR